MIAYASSTRTRRNVAALHRAGWRLLLTPEAATDHGMPYALDNGAWGAHCRGVRWNRRAFERLVAAKGAGADFVVLPDIVAGGQASLRRSLCWRERLCGHRLLLLPVQDGMMLNDVAEHLDAAVGLFIGGTTEWKLSTLGAWGWLAQQRRCYLHVARVNTRRRIRLCHLVGADSFDGTSATRYAVTLPELDEARRQPSLWGKRACVGR